MLEIGDHGFGHDLGVAGRAPTIVFGQPRPHLATALNRLGDLAGELASGNRLAQESSDAHCRSAAGPLDLFVAGQHQ